MKKIHIIIVFIYATLLPPANAESLSNILNRYPADTYFVGVGTVQSTENADNDKRRATILARLEIAKSIKVTVQEHTIDMMCSRPSTSIYTDTTTCKNEFSMIVEESVSQVLEGSSIVDSYVDRKNSTYTAIAILPKAQAAKKADDEANALVKKAGLHLSNAKKATLVTEKTAEIDLVKDDMKKALAFEGQRSAIENSKISSDEMFDQIISDMVKAESH